MNDKWKKQQYFMDTASKKLMVKTLKDDDKRFIEKKYRAIGITAKTMTSSLKLAVRILRSNLY